jgi:hypothetical protein
MRQISALWFLAVLVAPTAVLGGGLELSPELTGGQLLDLSEHLAEAMDIPAGPARSLGVTGFELHVGGMWVDASEDAAWWRNSITGGSEVLDGMEGYHVLARKGLPRGLDVGAQYGSLMGEDYWGLELRAAMLRGGPAEPALGVRAAWSQLAGGPLDLQVATAQATLSKGFAIFTPYVAAGMRWIDADASVHTEPASIHLDADSDAFVVNAGVHVDLPPFGVRIEARRGHATAVFVSAGFNI